MGKRIDNFKTTWRGIRQSARFRNLLLYLGFVVLATFFWVIMAMNDSVQESFDVRLNVVGVPDSVTFINDPPEKIHVTVRDKGTRLFRAGFNDPRLTLNFREYASGGVLRFTPADLNASLRTLFGSGAQVTSVSIDSLHLAYTKDPGKRVPIVLVSDIQTVSGKVISGRLKPSVTSVLLYTSTVNLDTVSRVYTRKILRRKLAETTDVEIGFQPINGVKIIPSKIKVTIPVEPLVKKSVMVPITVKNLPNGYSLLLFPDNMEVTYFVPMDKFSAQVSGITLSVDFDKIVNSKSRRAAVNIDSYPSTITNVSLKSDSVEYTIVK